MKDRRDDGNKSASSQSFRKLQQQRFRIFDEMLRELMRSFSLLADEFISVLISCSAENMEEWKMSEREERRGEERRGEEREIKKK